MSSFSLTYIIGRFFYRIGSFFSHWYAGSFLVIARETINVLELLDRSIAFKVTLMNISQPLYQDHTAIGHILGFIFRVFRIITGGLLYMLLILLGAFVYIIWIAIPSYIIMQGFLALPL